MEAPTSPGRPIETAADLVAAAGRQGLVLTAGPSDLDRTGLDFLVVHARDEHGVRWVVRTPRRPEVFESTYVEARVLRLVGPCLPVAVPDWRIHASDVIAYPRLDGTPAVTLSPTGVPGWNVIDPAALSDTFIASVARALSALQAISPRAARRAGVPVKPLPVVREALAASMARTREALAPSERVWARWQRWLSDDASWSGPLALVHGDLHPGHMLLDAGGHLTGVLDWTEACMTDASIDLAMFYGCFGRPALDRLLVHFEAAGGRIWPRLAEHATERWAAFPVLAADWALRAGNDSVLAHGRAQLAAIEGTDASAP